MKAIFDRFKKLFKTLTLGVAFAALLFVCMPAAICADAVFSPAPDAPHVLVVAPATPAPIVAPAPTWVDRVFSTITSPPFIAGVAYVFLKLLAAAQAKTTLNLTKAIGAAHSVFNALFDAGFIKNGTFRAAEEAFFQEFDKQYFNAYGHAPDSAAQDNAHAEFTQLFTDNTPSIAPPAQAPV